ncbi:MAG: AmmeMemoRadiSam system radical SAM enzyme [Holophagaceae bacterium]|nr:AmmeMemoRadiSam system radical SAM enzyme [Holophagaceae bacterium]
MRPGLEAGAEARWWHALADGRIQCDLCPRDCRLQEGQQGFCAVRGRRGNRLWLSAWGQTSGLAVDPIEKKPLAHFYPGSRVLSFGTAGCNLGCRFCQNWDLSRARARRDSAEAMTPEAIAETAVRHGCQSVAFTYNDPVVFTEWAVAVAEACRARGLRTVCVTAGYLHPGPRCELFGAMDAANVDLKAFSEDFYARVCLAHLQPVLETLDYLAKETAVWLEVTTLLIPGHNDSEDEVARLVDWLVEHLGPQVPLHLTGFHPDFRMLEVPATPLATLRRARAQALAAGLRHVYLGNVRDPEGDTTRCASCGGVLIARDGYILRSYRLTREGCCPDCLAPLAGRFA